jgi:hypothetical protein
MPHRKPRVLLADNLIYYGRSLKPFMEDDFDYTFTSSLPDALLLMKYDWFPIVLIDKRWGEEEQEGEVSGLKILQEAPNQIIRCLITSYPSAEEEISWMNRRGFNIAHVFYKDKYSHEALAEELRQIAREEAHINWDLVIYPSIESVNLGPLFKELEKIYNPPPSFTPSPGSRLVELLDLLGKIFSSSQQIELGEQLWERSGRLALPVKALAENRPEREFVLVLGSNPTACRERQAYKEICEYQGSQGTYTSQDVFETTHLGANLYHLNSSISLADLDPFHRRIFSMPSADVKHSLKIFLTDTLPPIKRVGKNNDLGQLYLDQLGLPALDSLASRIEAVIAHLVPKLRVHDAEIIRQQGEMLVQVKGSAAGVFPDPAALLNEGLLLELPQMASAGLRLTNLNSILSSAHHQIWLTDFLDAGMLPLLWMPTELEAAVRYDWTSDRIHEENLACYHLFEQTLENCFYQPVLAEGEKGSFSLPDEELCLPDYMGRVAQAVWMIRDWARRSGIENTYSYRTAMFYQAAHRLLDYYPDRLSSQKELTRFGHLLISMAVLGRDLVKLKPAPPAPERRPLVFDEAQQQFTYLGTPLMLTPPKKPF